MGNLLKKHTIRYQVDPVVILDFAGNRSRNPACSLRVDCVRFRIGNGTFLEHLLHTTYRSLQLESTMSHSSFGAFPFTKGNRDVS